jgi:endonuclease-3 related protein
MADSPELLAIYDRLRDAYGPQAWWPAQTAFQMIVGAILTQNTAWTNAEKAIQRLREASVLSPEAIAALEEEALAELIRPSGTFRVKGRMLKAFCSMLERSFGGRLEALLALPLEDLRARLLDTHGIGPETADAIVLYAAGQPSFVVDAYTRRMFRRLGLAPLDASYEGWRRFFMSTLPADAPLFNEYHALIVRHAKQSCRKRPCCVECVLRPVCREGAARAAIAAAGDTIP